MPRSPSARCLPTITFVTDCSARSVSPRQPISGPRSRPLMSSVIGSAPCRTLTKARTPMCFNRPSTRVFAASALPLAGACGIPVVGAPWSMIVTSTTVSSAVSLRILTSTLRRLSWSTISAASTASSSVRPRPSADLKFVHSLPSTFFRLSLFVRAARLSSLGDVGHRLAPEAGRCLAGQRRRSPRDSPEPRRQQVAPPDHEALLNDTYAVPDEPVEAESGGNVQGEVADHQGRDPHHRPLHLQCLELLLGRVRRRRHLQHLRLDERRDRGEQGEDEIRDRRDRQAWKHQLVVGVLVEVCQEQEVRGDVVPATEVGEHVVESRQDRQLNDQGQAADQTAERVDPVFLVQLHHLGVQPLRLFLVLLAKLRDLRGELALLDHRLALSHELELLERREQQPDEDRQEDDRDAVSADRTKDRYTDDVGVDIAEGALQGGAENRPPYGLDGLKDVEWRAEKDGLVP